MGDNVIPARYFTWAVIIEEYLLNLLFCGPLDGDDLWMKHGDELCANTELEEPDIFEMLVNFSQHYIPKVGKAYIPGWWKGSKSDFLDEFISSYINSWKNIKRDLTDEWKQYLVLDTIISLYSEHRWD